MERENAIIIRLKVRSQQSDGGKVSAAFLKNDPVVKRGLFRRKRPAV